jgi:ubiquinone biosynthesis protein
MNAARLRPLWRFASVTARTMLFAATTGAGYHGRRLTVGRPAALRYAGARLRRHLERLGPTFIKLGQLLATRRDLMPAEMLEPLLSLHRNAKAVPFTAIDAALRQSFGARFDELFAGIDPEPLGTGAIAQVHRARLRGGGEVALKVLKPGARELLAADMRVVAGVAGLLERLPGMRDMPARAAMSELSAILTAQADLAREAECLRRFRENFRQVEGIRFAAPVDALCTPEVLAMEYVAPLERLDALEVDDVRRKRFALAGLHALYRMIFDHGLVHADMHPGNVLRGDNDRLVILDTGLICDIGVETQSDFVDFFFAVVNNQGRACADLLWRTAMGIRDAAMRPAFDVAIEAFIAREAAKRSGAFNVTGFVYEMLDIQRRHGVRSSPDFIGLVLAMTVYDGVCRMLYPGCDFQGEARGYLIAARYRRAAPRRVAAG